MKRNLLLLTACLLAVALALVLGRAPGPPLERQGIKIGVSIYRGNDTFVEEIVTAMEAAARRMEQEQGLKISLEVANAKESQRTQNDQIKRYIALDYDVICVNLVDRTNASVIIDAAMDANIPLVFFNREPVSEDILRGEHIYYVGADAKTSALLQGGILLDAYRENPGSIDKNDDNRIQYVMLEGEVGHQDAIIRTEYSVQALTSRGVEMELLGSGVANWERSQAAAITEQWAEAFGPSIEAVLCNNDEMALGAAEALERAGLTGVAVLGIDATGEGVRAVEDGRLLGTVDCNALSQGEAIYLLASSLALGDGPPPGLELERQRYVRVSLRQVTGQQ